MRVGTKSVLYGAHCFCIHPWFVFVAWWKLYGFPFDPRLWISFVIHDLGYIGKPNMDGLEGEEHPDFAARVMRLCFGARWYFFCRYHSRHLAKKDGQQYSRLCIADKLAVVITPAWLYLPCVCLSGEIREYMAVASAGKVPISTATPNAWYTDIQRYMRQWVAEHKDGREDTWTPETRNLPNGVL